jgi:hypothetical protein
MVNWDFDRDKTQFDTLSTKTLGQIRPGWQRSAEFGAFAVRCHGVHMQRPRGAIGTVLRAYSAREPDNQPFIDQSHGFLQ